MKDTAKETSDAEHYAAIGHNPTESGFKQALRASSVVLASFVVLGLGLGVIISAHHLPWWLAPAISLIVYAGSVEFLVVEMIATGASVGAIGFTTLLVNSRHLVYGISFPLQNVKGFWAKLYAIYTLCDESYALNTGPDRNTLSHARILWVSTFLHISWVAGTTA
ncbi:AzlC family ABC transporter permease, partial [Rothia dentocariosa]